METTNSTLVQVIEKFLANTTNPEVVNQLVAIFGSGENVAVFDSFSYKSNAFSITATSPFSIYAKVKDGKITYFQFMEDTFATAATFKVSGTVKYHSDPNGSEVEL
jgi:hypothetical protein